MSKIPDKWFWLIILLLAVVFRVYNFENSFSFAHDQDLYSWIAKDIVINKHLRLAGQITSVEGVFIGPAYYYLMAFFYAISSMNPLSVIWPLTIIGLLNVASFYWVIKKFFGESAGRWAALIWATSMGSAWFDRWSVPTQPTILWSIWFVYVILSLTRGNYKVFPLYGLLVGLLWNVHIALLPILPIPLLAYLFAKGAVAEKWKNCYPKIFWATVLVFMVSSAPLWVFELKHSFSQVKSLAAATQKKIGGPTGVVKFKKVLNASGREFQNRLFLGWDGWKEVEWLWVGWLLVTVWLIAKKHLGKTDAGWLGLWVGLVMLAQFTSKRIVSEYYFTNLVPIYILFLALLLAKMKFCRWQYGLVAGWLVINLIWLFNKSVTDDSYKQKLDLVDYVANDAKSKNYDCVAINHIADLGVGTGFRYLFWYRDLDLIKTNSQVPIYNIVIPWQISQNEVVAHFGRLGVILPDYHGTFDKKVCNDPANKLDPLLGYTE